ncbi:unnamed protein product [Prorocentrum cordatum]|uniref:Uncharacterized protein n=1 Tax=Prorocentrum cordatum TaxID=2364126 RepID=A0ABN9XNK2_9DINO|nr:unnamed protein product [Polarella glacialis]
MLASADLGRRIGMPFCSAFEGRVAWAEADLEGLAWAVAGDGTGVAKFKLHIVTGSAAGAGLQELMCCTLTELNAQRPVGSEPRSQVEWLFQQWLQRPRALPQMAFAELQAWLKAGALAPARGVGKALPGWSLLDLVPRVFEGNGGQELAEVNAGRFTNPGTSARRGDGIEGARVRMHTWDMGRAVAQSAGEMGVFHPWKNPGLSIVVRNLSGPALRLRFSLSYCKVQSWLHFYAFKLAAAAAYLRSLRPLPDGSSTDAWAGVADLASSLAGARAMKAALEQQRVAKSCLITPARDHTVQPEVFSSKERKKREKLLPLLLTLVVGDAGKPSAVHCAQDCIDAAEDFSEAAELNFSHCQNFSEAAVFNLLRCQDFSEAAKFNGPCSQNISAVAELSAIARQNKSEDARAGEACALGPAPRSIAREPSGLAGDEEKSALRDSAPCAPLGEAAAAEPLGPEWCVSLGLPVQVEDPVAKKATPAKEVVGKVIPKDAIAVQALFGNSREAGVGSWPLTAQVRGAGAEDVPGGRAKIVVGAAVAFPWQPRRR